MITNAQRALKFFKWLEEESDYSNWHHNIKKEVEGKLIEILDEKEELPYENVKCPECDGPMVSRSGTYGTFWGCKAYPNCRGTRDSQGRSKAERDEEKNRTPEPKKWNVT